MLDGMPLIDAHQHPVRLSTVKPAWMDWAARFGQPGRGRRDRREGRGRVTGRAGPRA